MKMSINNNPVWEDKNFAESEAVLADIDAVIEQVSAPSFQRDWEIAPRSFRNYVTEADAEYWWLQGRKAGQVDALAAETSDLKEMARLMKERGLR